MANRFTEMKTLSDYQRADEEFKMRKAKQAQDMALSQAQTNKIQYALDNPGSGEDSPSSVREAKHLEGLLQAKNYDEANRYMALKRASAYGVDSYGAPMQPQFAPEAPQFAPEAPQEFIPNGQPLDAQQRAASTAPQQQFTPQTPNSIAQQLAQNAKLKKAMEVQGQKDVELTMNPQIEAATKTSGLKADYLEKGRQSLPKMQRTLQSKELQEEFLQPKIADLNNRATNLWSATGFTGSLVGAIPGTPAADFAKDVGTLLANAGFDRLQEMRDNSPTGGALGQVSEMELQLLQSAAQNLMNSQSEGQFRKNLASFQQQRIRSMQNVRKAYEEDYQRFGGQSDAYLPSPESMANSQSRQVLAPYEGQAPKTPKGGVGEVKFNLKKKGFTEEQINEFLKGEGLI